VKNDSNIHNYYEPAYIISNNITIINI